ncbi:MAG: Fe-S protein assembly co-chaperone HscB [Saprospiraceae bacterium]|nr:Fe-S protein assembly co-chaperone HscB [Saprospiraceae bacterium]
MNYFEFYNLPISFNLDEAALKRLFYANSKRFHPDFYTLDTEEKQNEILELSTLNTQAYKTLSDFDRRMKYVLDLKGIFAEEGKNALPQDFLMDMMDINEAIMELEFDFDESAYQKVVADVQSFENQILSEVTPIIENYQDGITPDSELEKVKIFFLKKRYLLRILENVSKFAPH